MKKITLIFLVVLSNLLTSAHLGFAQTPEWTRVLQVNTFGLPVVNVVTAEGSNVYMAATFSGPLTFDGISYSSSGFNDMLLVKMNNSGVAEWVKQFNAQIKGSINPNAIKVDAEGNIFITGSFSGSMTVGSNTITSGATCNSFYAKFNTSGDGEWIAPFLCTNLYGSSKIAFDGGGNSYVVGFTTKLLKFGSAGSLLWEQSFPVRTLQAIAVSGTDLYLGGALQPGTTNFGTIPLTSLGGYNTGFLVKGDLDGVYSNSSIVGGSTSSYGSSISDIVPDNAGNIIITGCYTKNLILGDITIENSTRSYYTYIAKCNDNFSFSWAKSSSAFININRDMFNYRIFLDNSNNIFEFGMIGSTITYGTVTLTLNTIDQFLFKFDADGNVLNGFALQNASSGRMCVNISGKILTGGTFDFAGSSSYGNLYFTMFDENLQQEWQKVSSKSLSGIAKINCIKHDAAGNSYIRSRLIGHCDYFGTIVNTNDYITVISKHDIAGNLLWMNQIADFSPEVYGSSFTLDKDDNVLTLGLFKASLNIGTVTLTSTNAGYEGYVAKYNTGGDFQWASKMNLNADISTYISVATDKTGKVLVSGVVEPANFLVKFDVLGNQLWAKTFPMESYYTSLISTDAQNNIYLTSEIYLVNSTGSTTIGSVTLNQTNEDGATALVKFDPDGNAIWAKTYGGITGGTYPDGWPCDIKTDATGNTYLWGWCPDQANFGTTTLINPLSSNTGWSYFLTKISTSGDVVWAKAVYEAGQSFNYGDLLDLDQNGNVYVGGHFNNKISVEGAEFMPEGTNDYFTIKYSGSGVYQWIKTIPANANIMNALSVFDENIVSLAGAAGKNSTLDGFNINRKGGSDCMVATMAILNPAPTPLNIPATGGSTITFNIFSDSTWIASSNQSWLTISSGSGTGCASITFTASANPSTNPRTAVVTITYSGIKTTVQTITIIQAAGTFGISELSAGAGIIYPNPATDFLFFDAKVENAEISVFNSAGKMLINEHVVDNKVNVSRLNKGVYAIIIVDNTGVAVRLLQLSR
ncbi:MAG: T9SS type A sorting domain-containing protein [Bacteroidetes bacterium]|nr:T9SS type A sorting domain-containing protein [Bacteroidota bacterium]